MTLKKWIPSIITISNLISGVLAMLLNEPNLSLILISSGAFFDVFDGIIARALKVQSEFGKQLDSFADLITFGIAPAFLVYNFCFSENSALRYLVILIPVFSAIRLVKFTISENQKTCFLGLPIPANGLFFASLPIATTIKSETLI